MDINIDIKKLYNYLIIEKIDDGTEKGKMTADVLRVFEKHGIDAMEAALISLEITEIMNKYAGGEKQ